MTDHMDDGRDPPKFSNMNGPTKLLYLAACGLLIAVIVYTRFLHPFWR